MDKRYQKVRDFYKSRLNTVIQILVKEGVHSNIFSFTVFFLCLVFTFFTLSEGFRQAGAVALLIAICDIIGSLTAEAMGETQKKSALLDSILDKYSEIIFYSSMIVVCLQIEYTLTALFAYLSLIGSAMSTFVIIRSEQFGLSLDWGFIRRPERIMIIGFGMFFGLIGLLISTIIVAAVSNTTAVYFIWHIWFNKKK
jgi:phosphatidylglycerophosphate synthase